MRILLLVPSLLLGCGDQLLTNVKDPEAPAISVTPTSLFFDAAGSQVVTIASVGVDPLDVSSVAMRSDGAFTLTDNGGLPATLEPGSQTAVVVTWAPGSDVTGWLDIVSNDPTTPLVPVSLSATPDDTGTDTGTDTGDTGTDTGDTGDTGTDTGDTGTDTGDTGDTGDTAPPEPAAMLDPTSATLEAAVGDTDTALFTLYNTGATELTVGASVSGAGYALTSSVPPTLAIGDSFELDVAFTPTAEGVVMGSLDVTISGLPTLSATLTGTGLAAPSPDTFTWTGSAQTYTVPSGVYSLTIDAWGAGGGAGNYTGAYAGNGGGGAHVATTVSVSPGDVLTIRPGEGGHVPGGGGGGTFVWDDAGTLIVAAAGGGGGATDGGSLLAGSGAGGAGGADAGETGGTQYDPYWGSASGGSGGTVAAGGAAGTASLGAASGPACTGEVGSATRGGGGATGYSSCTFGTAASQDAAGVGGSNGSGGGGGSGWYGGGGGGSVYTYFGGGGGGGSSWATAGTLDSGSGMVPGGTGSAEWDGLAGVGGLAGLWPSTPSTDGAPGRVTIR